MASGVIVAATVVVAITAGFSAPGGLRRAIALIPPLQLAWLYSHQSENGTTRHDQRSRSCYSRRATPIAAPGVCAARKLYRLGYSVNCHTAAGNQVDCDALPITMCGRNDLVPLNDARTDPAKKRGSYEQRATQA